MKVTDEVMNAQAYQDALHFLYCFIDYERNNGWKYDSAHFDLGRVRDFLNALGNPHKQGAYVHVAGTNGKGSTAAMIANALAQAGYRTGLYTSPHLITFRERIRINGAFISPADVIEGVNQLRPITEQFPGLTFFEVWTGLAFNHFARQNVDISVIEVGMGGRLDTTNVITPDVSVITRISMDHHKSLGSTVSKIAEEKAGIIKPGIPVVSPLQHPDAHHVIEEKACFANAPITFIGHDVTTSSKGNRLSYRSSKWNCKDIRIPLAGSFQHENAAVAMAALEQLALRGYRLTPDDARKGIETVLWPGRLQTVRTEPSVLVDGACNFDAMQEVVSHLRATVLQERTVGLIGICQDKDVKQVLELLGCAVSRFVFTQVENPRAVSADALAGYTPVGVPFTVQPDPVLALAEASALAGPDGTVMVTGSLYLVGEVMRHLGVDPLDGKQNKTAPFVL